MNQAEHIEAVALIRWVRLSTARFPALATFYHVPNGGDRNIVVASKMKAEGVKPGVSDYCLPAARGGFFGLYIELKSLTGRKRKSQRDFLDLVRAEGYRGEFAFGWIEARAILLDYLNQPKTEVKPC